SSGAGTTAYPSPSATGPASAGSSHSAATEASDRTVSSPGDWISRAPLSGSISRAWTGSENSATVPVGGSVGSSATAGTTGSRVSTSGLPSPLPDVQAPSSITAAAAPAPHSRAVRRSDRGRGPDEGPFRVA